MNGTGEAKGSEPGVLTFFNMSGSIVKQQKTLKFYTLFRMISTNKLKSYFPLAQRISSLRRLIGHIHSFQCTRHLGGQSEFDRWKLKSNPGCNQLEESQNGIFTYGYPSVYLFFVIFTSWDANGGTLQSSLRFFWILEVPRCI